VYTETVAKVVKTLGFLYSNSFWVIYKFVMQVSRLNSEELVKLVLNSKTLFANIRGKFYSGEL